MRCGFVIQGAAWPWRRGLQGPGAWAWGRRWPGPAVAPSPVGSGGGGPASAVMFVSDTAWELSHTLCCPGARRHRDLGAQPSCWAPAQMSPTEPGLRPVPWRPPLEAPSLVSSIGPLRGSAQAGTDPAEPCGPGGPQEWPGRAALQGRGLEPPGLRWGLTHAAAPWCSQRRQRRPGPGGHLRGPPWPARALFPPSFWWALPAAPVKA